MTQDDLTKLAIKYGTDRHPGSKHSYTPYYFKIFKDQRESIKKVLEIGVGEGPGLRMWQDFFPNALIYGAEVDPNRLFEEGRIKVLKCDQSKTEDLESVLRQTGADIDFVVEDGSHKPEDQILTCLTLMPLLKKDVIYIIEDVADLNIIKSLKDYDIEVPRLDRRKERYDDWLVVVKKKYEQ
jgi:hypothetical protein